MATDINYQSKDNKLKETFNADFTSTSNRQDMRQRQEQFLEGSRPTSFTEAANRSGNRALKLHNELVMTRSGYTRIETHYNYARRNGSFLSAFDQWDGSPVAAMRSVGMSEDTRQDGKLVLSSTFNVGKGKLDDGNISCGSCRQRMSISLNLAHEADRAEQAGRYHTRQHILATEEVRRNANDYENQNTWGVLSMGYYASGGKKMDFHVGNTLYFIARRTHDYLYHPDTLMLASQLDALAAITDPGNSYDGRFNVVENQVNLSLSTDDTYKVSPNSPFTIHYLPWRLGLSLRVRQDRLDYCRGTLDTLFCRNSVFIDPDFSYRYKSQDGKRDFRFYAKFTQSPPYVYDLVDYRDNSRPLVVKLGNPHLKGYATSAFSADYTDQAGRNQHYHLGASLNYQHRAMAQSSTYDPESGTYTYRPMNVSGGYTAGGKADYTRWMGKDGCWTLQTNADARWHHSVDYAMFAGETESRVNIVNTLSLHDNTYVQYNKGTLNVRATGDITWRHSTGRMHDFSTLDAFDFRYGLSARYTLPRLNTTLSADGTMYSRRGYGSAELNTDDFVLNASLSQPFLKGKLIARIEAFDLLHQLSSTQYSVNAQGRTETWYRSLPHYVMFHLVYHWNRNPKRQ